MNRTTPPPAAVSRLPILAIAGQANAMTLGQAGPLLRAVAMPFLLSMAIAAFTVALPAYPLLSMLLAMAGLVPYALFGVAWCRYSLLGPAAGRPPLLPSLARRHWRYLGYLAALAFMTFVLLVPPLFMLAFQAMSIADSADADAMLLIFVLGEVAVILGASYLAARLSFVFPAVAADEAYTWRHSWAHTRGQGFRLLSAIVLSMIPMIAALWLLSSVLGVFSFPEVDPAVMQGGANPEQVIEDYLAANAGRLAVAQAAITAMSYLVLGVAMSAIAQAFRISTGWVAVAALPPVQA